MKRVLLVVAAALVLAGFGAACSSDTDDLEDRIAALEAQQGNGESDELAQRTSIVVAVQALGTAGLHAIDENANENNTVEAGASGPVGRAILAVAATDWPDELQAGAGEVQAVLEELAEALAADEPSPAVVGPPAAEAHELAHEFEEEAANHVKEEVGLPVEEHEEEGTAEPAADATAEATP